MIPDCCGFREKRLSSYSVVLLCPSLPFKYSICNHVGIERESALFPDTPSLCWFHNPRRIGIDLKTSPNFAKGNGRTDVLWWFMWMGQDPKGHLLKRVCYPAWSMMPRSKPWNPPQTPLLSMIIAAAHRMKCNSIALHVFNQCMDRILLQSKMLQKVWSYSIVEVGLILQVCPISAHCSRCCVEHAAPVPWPFTPLLVAEDVVLCCALQHRVNVYREWRPWSTQST